MNQSFLSIIKTQLWICNLNGIFYYYIDKKGRMKYHFLSISIAISSAVIFLVLSIYFCALCPSTNNDASYYFMFSIMTYVTLLYMFSAFIWFGLKNNILRGFIENYEITDNILHSKLNIKIDYNKSKFYNRVRLVVTFLVFSFITFIEIIYIVLAQDDKRLFYCSAFYIVYYYITAHINWLYQTLMYELKMRLNILRICSKKNCLSANNVLTCKVVYWLLISFLKPVKILFTLHAFGKGLYLFFGCLTYASFIITTKMDTSAEYLINLVSFSWSMLLVILEMVLFVYAFQSFKEEVSFLNYVQVLFISFKNNSMVLLHAFFINLLQRTDNPEFVVFLNFFNLLLNYFTLKI